MVNARVSRNSHHCAAASFANFAIEGHWQLIDLVWLWFRVRMSDLACKNDADVSTATRGTAIRMVR